MDTTGTIDSKTGESTATQSTESTGQGPVESQGSQGQEDNAGSSQEQSEGSKEQGTDTRRPFRSKNQTIYELRQAVRERDAKLSDLEQRFSQFEQKFQPRGQNQKPSRTFWEAPEEVIDERFSNHAKSLKEELLQELRQVRESDQQTAEWKQETLEATKLIKDTLKLTADEEDELSEMLREKPHVMQMRPSERAEYAIFLWNKQKGVGDRSDMKRKAASVTGASAQGADGKKIWTEEAMKRELSKLPPDPATWTKEQNEQYKAMDAEFRLAYREKRVRN